MNILTRVQIYLSGFAVAVGNFCGNLTVCFAVSNRMPNGKVRYISYSNIVQVFLLLSKPKMYH